MDDGTRETTDGTVTRVSDALVEKERGSPLRIRIRQLEVWLLVDVPRWVVVVGLVAAVFAVTVCVGVFGPASVREYLLDGTPIANAYIELQPGAITAITVVLAINQLVLSPEFGSIRHQTQRREDTLSFRTDVEERAGVVSSPTDPAAFLRTIADGLRERLLDLEAVADERDDELREQLADAAADIRADVRPIGEELDRWEFSDIELYGAAIHFDATGDVHRIRGIQRRYGDELSASQSAAIEAVLETIGQFESAREYFRTRYIQTQFIQFSRAMLFTGMPAIAVAHYSVGIIGPGVLAGATLGVRDLLWFEAAAFAVAVLPVAVIVSYVARIVTLAETSIFIGPFSAEQTAE